MTGPGRFGWPHLAVGPSVVRHDVGDDIARRAGMSMTPTACGQEIVCTLTTRRRDKVRCPACLAAPIPQEGTTTRANS